MELLQYLDMEETWLNSLEEKVAASDNLPESAEEVSGALDVRRGARASVHTHTGKHRLCMLMICPQIQNKNLCRTL